MKVAVLLGGPSNEREISLKSGMNVISAIEKLGYEVIPIDPKDGMENKIKELKSSDLVFIALHGEYGEDGKIQGFLDTLNIKYVGSGVEACSIGFDKALFYSYVSKQGIKVPNWILTDKVISSPFDYPVVIKPRRSGSSIGVHINHDERELFDNLRKELEVFKEMIIQEYIKGREVTVSVIEINKKPTVLPILELRPKKEFYDYEAKYTAGMTEFVVPSPLEKDLEEKVKKTALKVFELVGCKDMARVDGIIKDNEFYVLEVNTIPGLTDLSDLPISARAMGISFEKLIEILISNNI